MELQLRTAGEQDLALIAAMADRIWKIHYPPIIGMEQVEYMLNKMYSAEALIRQMGEGQVFRIIESDTASVGFISVSEKEEHELFLHKFYLDANVQGRGMGAAVFSQLMAMYPGVKKVRLTVNRQNYKSINFYFKLGFTIAEVADFDIGEGYLMNDFVMELQR